MLTSIPWSGTLCNDMNYSTPGIFHSRALCFGHAVLAMSCLLPHAFFFSTQRILTHTSWARSNVSFSKRPCSTLLLSCSIALCYFVCLTPFPMIHAAKKIVIRCLFLYMSPLHCVSPKNTKFVYGTFISLY